MNILKLAKMDNSHDPTFEAYTFYCPACKRSHQYIVNKGVKGDANCPEWAFNGNVDSPTFTPSLLMRTPQYGKADLVCHLFLTDGVIHYCADCSHEMAGQSTALRTSI